MEDTRRDRKVLKVSEKFSGQIWRVVDALGRWTVVRVTTAGVVQTGMTFYTRRSAYDWASDVNNDRAATRRYQVIHKSAVKGWKQ